MAANPRNYLSYNGVTMDLVKQHSWERQFIYNGNQYLYTRHILSVTVVLNPQTNPTLTINRFLPPGGGNPPVPALTGTLFRPGQTNVTQFLPAVAGVDLSRGAVTDSLIRHVLGQPRQQLLYVLQGYAPLASPWAGFITDSTGGPLPLKLDVVQEQSDHTWILNYVIQTDINDCQRYTNKPKILLSHTWSMSHELDPDCFTVRVIEGRAVFSRDRLEANPVTNPVNAAIGLVGGGLAQVVASVPPILADDFRSQLFHEIPTNFKREKVTVKLQPDGVTLDYVIMDRERALNFNFPNVTRVEGTHKVTTQWGGIAAAYEAIKGAVLGGLRATEENLRFAEGNLGVAVPGLGQADQITIAADAQLASAARITAERIAGIAEGLIPQITHNIVLRLWGNRDCTRQQLTAYAYLLLFSRLSLTNNEVVDQLNKAVNPIPPAVVNLLGQLGFSNKDLTDAANNLLKLGLLGPNVAGVIENVGSLAAIGTIAAGFHTELTHDLAGKFVELRFASLGSPLSLLFAGPTAFGMLTANDDTSLKFIDKNKGILDKDTTLFDKGFPTPDQTRGTYIERLVTQILMEPCETPPQQSKTVVTLTGSPGSTTIKTLPPPITTTPGANKPNE